MTFSGVGSKGEYRRGDYVCEREQSAFLRGTVWAKRADALRSYATEMLRLGLVIIGLGSLFILMCAVR